MISMTWARRRLLPPTSTANSHPRTAARLIELGHPYGLAVTVPATSQPLLSTVATLEYLLG